MNCTIFDKAADFLPDECFRTPPDLAIILDANGYPPVAIDEAYKEVLEQAENFRKYAG